MMQTTNLFIVSLFSKQKVKKKKPEMQTKSCQAWVLYGGEIGGQTNGSILNILKISVLERKKNKPNSS